MSSGQRFHQSSYNNHAKWYNKNFPTYAEKVEVLNSFKSYEGSINHWLQGIFFDCLNPLITEKEKSWLTIGDAYGHDHHFPRPYAALYEMIRVAREAIVIIEPQDPISKMPLLLSLVNICGKINPNFINKIWKNRFSFEPVGNYVYKVSER